jgi:methionyl aminopeptidase
MDIEQEARILFKENKAIPAQIGYHGYRHAICCGINSDAEHCIPTSSKTLHEGDTVTIDTVVKKMGFHADGGLTLALGKVDPETQRLLDTTKNALMAAVNASIAGNYVIDISNAIADIVEPSGFHALVNFAAHGIGREMHEEPDILNVRMRNKGSKLLEGMVFALDTMVSAGNGKVKFLKDGWSTKTEDGKNFAFFEYTVIVRKNKAEIINPFSLE